MVERICELNEHAKKKGKPLPYPLDECVFADTGFEFPYLYDYIKIQAKRLEKTYNIKCVVLKPDNKLWEKWFYGKRKTGKLKGTQRGFPMVINPCRYSRESKIKPLEKYYSEKSKVIYVGIAHDEPERIRDDDFIRYPLDDWGWSEVDCAKYLKKKGLWNELYNDFDRLGCFFCHKQSLWSWYMLWQKYPKLYEKAIFWDNESRRITIDAHGIRIDMTLEKLRDKFKDGFRPKRKKNFISKLKQKSLNDYKEDSCDAVASAFSIRDKKLKIYEQKIKEIDGRLI